MSRSRALATPFLLLSAGLSAASDDPLVHAWQDSIQLPTYRLGEAAIPDAANYPYPLLKNLTKDPQDRVWRTLNLENEYLFCRVLPDLGGHLYSCRDKRNGREMFYANPVIKPGDVGLRGAWAALGIESNFPVGHSRVSISPVDFAVRSDPDGAGRAIVEDIDRVTGMSGVSNTFFIRVAPCWSSASRSTTAARCAGRIIGGRMQASPSTIPPRA